MRVREHEKECQSGGGQEAKGVARRNFTSKKYIL
jgi:hypothetical protein